MASMEDLKTLRGKTGAGFADCKKALEKSSGDIAAAEKLLKEMGLAAASKRRGRATGEGSIFTGSSDDNSCAAIVELRCETDFVARNEDFQQLGKHIVKSVVEQKLTQSTDEINNAVTGLIGTIKENMQLHRFQLIEKKDNETLAFYTHGKPGRLGAIVKISADTPEALNEDKLRAFAHACALHAVARVPLYLSPETVDDAYKQTQTDIFTTQVANMGKPENVAAGIIQGKWRKHVDEICFVNQPWVHDEKSTPQKEAQALSKELEAKIVIEDYVIYVLGDG